MHPDLKMHLRSLTRLIHVVTEEEDRFLTDLAQHMEKHVSRIWVWNPAFGMRLIQDLISDWGSREHKEEARSMDIHNALIQVYKDDPADKENFYIFTDVDRCIYDEPHVIRRVQNILYQTHHDLRIVKVLMFLSSRRSIPGPLQRYTNVVIDTGLTPEETNATVLANADLLRVKPPENAVRVFGGMTSFEIEEAMTQSVMETKKEGKRIDLERIAIYKRNQLRKTSLVNFVDTSGVTFTDIGGADRFKLWAKKTSATWTEAGQAYGLVPPRGVLATGVYGCGKSHSIKALAAEWGLPLVQFELGRVMDPMIGQSESRLYHAQRMIEGVSPCIVWIDEAEKSLAGSQSSGKSDAGTTSRMLGILSTWIQETKAPICLAMTANNLGSIPPEIINRMSERFFFDLPDEESRIDIIKIIAKRMRQDVSNFNLADLAEKSKNLVGREIEQAMAAALVDSYYASKPGLDEEILGSVLSHKPRIIHTMKDEISEIIQWVGYDPDADDGIRARLASGRRSEQFRAMGAG